MSYDPSYKIRHCVTPVSRLAYYKRVPPPMVGDPHHCGWRGAGIWRNWDERCKAVYEAMMAHKRGQVARNEMRGLWFWGYRTQHETTCFELAGRL